MPSSTFEVNADVQLHLSLYSFDFISFDLTLFFTHSTSHMMMDSIANAGKQCILVGHDPVLTVSGQQLPNLPITKFKNNS